MNIGGVSASGFASLDPQEQPAYPSRSFENSEIKWLELKEVAADRLEADRERLRIKRESGESSAAATGVKDDAVQNANVGFGIPLKCRLEQASRSA